jgi:hypothetical protein
MRRWYPNRDPPGICLERLRKIMKEALLRIASVPAEIRTENLPITKLLPLGYPVRYMLVRVIRRGADKSLAFHIFLFAAQPKEFFLDGLKKFEQRSYKCVGGSGGICRVNTFFYPVACCFLYKDKDLSDPLVSTNVLNKQSLDR